MGMCQYDIRVGRSRNKALYGRSLFVPRIDSWTRGRLDAWVHIHPPSVSPWQHVPAPPSNCGFIRPAATASRSDLPELASRSLIMIAIDHGHPNLAASAMIRMCKKAHLLVWDYYTFRSIAQGRFQVPLRSEYLVGLWVLASTPPHQRGRCTSSYYK